MRLPISRCFTALSLAQALLVFCAIFASLNTARAQFSYSEDFKNSTAPGWVLNPSGNSNPGPILTSGATARTGDYATGTIDPSGAGWLRLTNNTTNLANAVYFDTPIPSAGNSVTIAFGANFWGGNNYANTGADGITFFLYDASKPFTVGSSGGAIGYAQGAGVNVNGLNGGFVGVAFDPYGNFSTTTEGRQGGTAGLQPNSVAVRGPGTGTTGYNYLAGTGNVDFTDTGLATVQDGTDGAVPALPYTIAFPTATTRPNQSTQYRNISITINESSQLLVSMQFGEDGLWYQMLNVDLSSFVRPEQLKMGFAAGTGAGTLVTEIGGLLTIQATAGSGNFIWDNRNGPSDSGSGNSVWGTGANDPLNWAGQTNPTLKSNVIFNSTYVSSAQNIDVNGSDKVITNVYFSGANSYNLSTTESRKLIFDSNTVNGLTSINLTNDAGGNAAHTIGLDVQMNKNLDINNNITPTFTITGNIDTGGNILGLKGAGTTVLSGAISGAGSLVKSDSGTTIIDGATANTYTGATTVSGGTLQIEKATALGSTAAGTVVAAGGTLALAGSGTTFAAEGLTLNGTGVSNAGALRNVSGANSYTGTVALGAVGANSIGVDAGSLNVSGVVSGAAGNNLTKVGNGTLTLSGTNTYSGNTTINAGTIAIAADSALGTAPGAATAGQLTLDGGTLQNTAIMTLNANRGIALGNSGGTVQTDANLTYNGIAAGSGALTNTGNATLVLGGANTYTGATNINQGTLQLAANNVLSDTTAVTVASGATFDVSTRTDTIGSLAGAGSVTLGAASALTTGANNASTTFSGIASGSGNLTKTGTGNFTLTGANTLTGNVTVGAGTLTLNNSGGQSLSGVSNITVNTGGTLTLGASNQINDSANLILSGGTFATGGFSETMRQLSQTTASTVDYLNDGSVLRFNGVNGSVSGLGTITGTLSINNWAGSIAGSGTEQLVVYSPSGAPTVTNLTFTDWGAATTILRTDLGAGFYEIVPTATGSYWDVNGSGTWNTGTNFASAANVSVVGPNANDAIAILGNTVSAPNTFAPLTVDPTITVSANQLVGKLIFENSANKSYTISGASRLDFGVASSFGQAQIIVNDDGSHVISTAARYNDNILITNNSTAATGLTLSGAIELRDDGTNSTQLTTFNGPGTTLVSGLISQSGTTGSLLKTGTGTLVLSNAASSYTGTTTLRSGTLEIDANAPSGAVGALGNSTGAVIVNDASTTATMNTSLVIGNTSVTIGRAITVGGNGAVTTLGGANSLTSGTGTFSGNVTLDKGVTLNADGTSTITFSGAIIDTPGTSTITKAGNGTVVLSGASANTGNGAVNINAGTLQISKTTANTALGDTSAVTVASGATLSLAAGLSETIGSLAGSGTVTAGNTTVSTATLTTGANNASTLFTGNITNSGNTTLALTKTGNGTLTLGGTGSYTYGGAVNVQSGTLTIQNVNALGNTTNGTTVLGGATLALDLAGSNTIANEALTLGNATTVGTLSSINATGNNTWTGGITLANTGTIQTDAGQFTLATGNITGAFGLNVAGAGNTTISSTIATGVGTLTKSGNGTLTLTGNNTFTGTTTINGGIVEIQDSGGLGTVAGGTTVATGATLALSNNITTAEGLTLNGQGVGSNGAIRNLSGSNTLSGAISLNASSYIGVDAASTLTATGIISGTGRDLTKVGNGTLILGGANTYTGTTAVNQGTLQITNAGALGTGAGVTTVANGASLRVTASGLTVAEVVTLSGDGVGGLGALQNTGGSNTWTGNLTMTGNSSIGVDGAANILSATGTIASSGGDFNLTKVGNGTLSLSGVNTYSGSTVVRNGTLSVNANSPVSLNGALGNSGSTVQIGDAGTAAADNLGLIIGATTGGVTIDRPIAVNSFNTSGTTTLGGTNSSGTNTFSGNLGLAKDTLLTSANGGTVAFTGDLSGAGGITTNGTGIVILSGNNSLAGAATVNSGATLIAASNNALGATSAGTTVNSGGTLGIQGGVTLPAAESLTISGTGVSNAGALNNISGTNTVTGNIALAASSNIGATAGTLNLNGVVSGTGFSLTKVGTGDVVLGGTSANTYTGGTTVSAGTLTLAKPAGTDATGSSGTLTVNTGGTLALGADNQINNALTLALNGGTFRTNNNSDTIGSLSLLGNSSINFSNGDSSVLTFTNAARTAGLLTIDDWNGIPTVGGGGSQLVFTNPGTGFGTSDISFAGFGAGWTRLASGEIVPIATSGVTYTWSLNAAGNWNVNNNWTSSPDGFPGAANDTAVFGNGILTASRTVTLGADRTLGYLAFSGTTANQYSLTGNTLIFDVTAGNAQIQVDDTAAPTIGSAILLNDNLNISSSSSGILTLNGAISGNTSTRNLSVNGSGTVDINGVIGTNMGTVTKSGSSTLILGAANTYTGATTVNNGTLQLDVNAPSGAAGALGNGTSNVVLGTTSSPTNATISLVSNGGATGNISVARNIDVNNYGTTTTIGGINTGGTNTFSGNIALNKTVDLTAAAGGTVDFSGVISGTGGIEKVGAGTVILSGTASNTFTGNVDIQAGTLQLAKSGAGVDAIGAVQGAIGDLAAVSLTGSSSVLSFASSGTYTLEEIGSLSGVAGSNVNVPNASNFTLYTGNNSLTTTFAGTLTNSGTGDLFLVKQGTGTMTLSGANTYDGTTLVTAGTLVSANNTALGTATGNTTVSGNATLGLQGGITIASEQLNLTAITSPNIASLANLSGTNTYGGNIAMIGGVANDQVKFDAAGGSTLTITGVISEASGAKVLAKTGTGTVILAGANTYTGATLVTAGTLVVANNAALGTTAAGTTVNIGATLGVQGNVTVASGETYTLNGTTNPPAAPSLKNISGTNTLDGNIALSGGINTGVSIDSNAGSLTLNGAITQNSNPNFVVKTGSGDLVLGGATSNTFSGGFTINDGRVIAAKTTGDATGAAAVNIGDSIGSAASATLQLNASNQINNASAVTIATDGKLDLNGFNDTIGALTMSGGSVTTTGTGTVTLGGNLTFTGVGANTASITANVDLGTTGTRIVQVGNNGSNADIDLTINGVISGGTGSLNKTDLGVLEIAGTTANTFTGGFQVSDGTVLLNKTAGVNATGGGTSVTVGDNVNAAGTAILKLSQSNQINNAATVTVNSDGRFDLNGLTETIGAIAGTGNIETRAGTLTIQGTNSISTFSGTLTDSTGVVGVENNIPGFSNGFVTSVGSGRVVLDAGTGSLTFNSNIAYAGTFELKSGTLFLPGVNFTVGTLEITGNTILDFGNSSASILNATNIRLAPGAQLTIQNWVNNVDFFFAQNWLAGTTVPGINTRGVGDETQITFTGFSNTQTAWLDYNNASKHQITPAPEPATYGAIFVGAAFALLGYRRWKTRTTAPRA